MLPRPRRRRSLVLLAAVLLTVPGTSGLGHAQRATDPGAGDGTYGFSATLVYRNSPWSSTNSCIGLANAGTAPLSGRATFTNRKGQQYEHPIMLGAGQSHVYPDIVSSFYGRQRDFGSVVVTADQPLAAAVQTYYNGNGACNGPGYAEGYRTGSGIYSNATQHFTPMYQGAGFSSFFVIQNAGDSPAVYQATLTDFLNGTVGRRNIRVKGNATRSYPLSRFPGAEDAAPPLSGYASPRNEDLFRGDAVVWNAGSGDLAKTPSIRQFSGTTSTYMPVIQQTSSWKCQLQIQNTGTSNASYSVTYYDSSGRPISSNEGGIDPGGASTRTCGNPDLGSFTGSAMVSSDQPIVAVANHQMTGSMSMAAGIRDDDYEETYMLMVPGLAMHQAATDRSVVVGAFDTEGATVHHGIMNLGRGTAVVRVSMYRPDGSRSLRRTLRVPASATVYLDVPERALAAGMYVDTRVRRRGPVSTFLLYDDPTGDRQYIPGTPME